MSSRFLRPKDARIIPTGLRLLRIAGLLVLLWITLVFASLAARDLRESDGGIRHALPPADNRTPALTPYGVTVQWEGRTATERAQALERLAESGIGWVRVRAGWEHIEPIKNRFQWQELDAWLADIDAAGLEPLLVLDGSPRWAQAAVDQAADTPFAPPAEVAAYAAFATTLAQRYAHSVRLYQIWDEPNIAPHWGLRHIDPVGYAQLLRAASAALRGADSDAIILTAALAPTRDRGHLAIDEVHFLQRMIAAGAADSFDAVAAQPFGFGLSPLHPRRQIDVLNFQRVALLRETLVNAGLAHIPIWAVRFGWNTRGDSPWATVSPEDQERYVAEARAVAARWPWLVALGWAIDQPTYPPDDPLWGFALTDGVLAALTGPLPALPLPATQSAAWRLAGLWAVTALIALAGARAIHALPLRRESFQTQPAWVQASAWTLLLVVYYFATPAPLVAACWLVGMGLAWAAPQQALWGALALLPFQFQHKEIAIGLWTIAIPPTIAALLLLLPTLLCEIPRQCSLLCSCTPWRRLHWADTLAALWLLLTLFSMLNVWHWGAYGRGVLDMTLAPLALYVALRLLIRPHIRNIHMAMGALALGGLIVAMIGLATWSLGAGVEIDGVRRLVGPHYSPNHTALYLVRSLFLMIGLAFAWHGARRRLGLVAGALLVSALLLTASRGALLLGIPAGVLLCLWLWALRGELPLGMRVRALMRRPLVRGALLIFPFILFAALFIGETRLLNSDSIDSRFILWQTATRLWHAHPWVGVGPGGFIWSYPAFLPPGTRLEPGLLHPHNSWLELATGWGSAGVLWLMALVSVWPTHTAQRLNTLPAAVQWPAIGLVGALGAALAHSQVDAFLALPDLAGWLFAALGLWVLIEQTTDTLSTV